MKKVLLLIFILFSSVRLTADDPVKDTNTFGREYFPFSDKVVLIYKSSFDEASSKTEVKNNTVILENKSDDFIYRQKFEIREDGLYISETYQKIKVILFIKVEKKVTYDKDLLKIPFPLKTGQQWSCNRTEYLDNGDSNKIAFSSKCVGAEEIQTLAGKFHTMKLESIIKSGDGSTNYVEEWIAPNIGLIKTKIRMEGGGFTGTIRDILGLGEINFELKEIKWK